MLYLTKGRLYGQPDRMGLNLAFALGILSFLIGAYEFFSRPTLAHELGLQGHEQLVYIYGAREILAGILIFVFSSNPMPWIWFRVLGDVVDVGTVVWGYNRHLAPDSNFVAAAIILAVAGVVDLYCAIRLTSDMSHPPSTRS